MKRITLCSFLIIIAINIFAHTGGNVEYTCPICDTKFETYTQFSYTTFGQNLDFRRYGLAIIPPPIPKCPNCNFVFSNDLFTGEEIIKIKTELEKNNLFIKEPNMPNYYLAREAEILNRGLEDIIWWFLSGVWENKDKTQRNRLINVTIEYINKLKETDESYNTYNLVKLDLLRRLGRFEDAMKLIETIKKNDVFYEGFIIKIIDLQIELIENKNQEEHPLPGNETINEIVGKNNEVEKDGSDLDKSSPVDQLKRICSAIARFFASIKNKIDSFIDNITAARFK
jgi:hypothetical protein